MMMQQQGMAPMDNAPQQGQDPNAAMTEQSGMTAQQLG